MMAWTKPLLVCLVLLSLASYAMGEVAEKDDQGVYILNHDNFDATVRSSPVVVVYFYATWCQKCEEFKVNFTSLREMSSALDNVAFAKINVENAQSLAEQYRVASYPNIIFFRDGTDYPHDSPDLSAKALFADLRSYARKGWTKPHQFSNHLTSDTFESTVKSGEGILVKFYARWCAHCRAMGEEWDKATRACEKFDPPMKMYQVDCEAEKQLCTDAKVEGFPTLRFYRRGKFVESYHGSRKKDDFIGYLERKTGEASRNLTPTKKRVTEHVEALQKRGQQAIVAFFQANDSESFDLYEMVADEIRDHIELAHVFSETLGQAYGIKGTHGIYISQPEHLRSEYEDGAQLLNEFSDDKEALKQWLIAKSRPLVGHLQSHNTGIDSIYWDINVATLYYTVDFGPEMIKSTQFWRKRLLRIAKDYRQYDNITFAVSDDEAASGLLKAVGLGDNSFDVGFIISGPEGKKYFPLEEDWDDDLYREHIDNFLSGKLDPYMKSETVPARNDGPVKICVGKNFKKLFDPTKDVLIEFYAPWCPHCRSFEPLFLRAARKMKGKVVFMKYNIMENQLPPPFEGKVENYPTTYFRAANQPELIKYEGTPSEDALVDWLKQKLQEKKTPEPAAAGGHKHAEL